MPLQQLVKYDPIEETAETEAEQNPGQYRKAYGRHLRPIDAQHIAARNTSFAR